MEMIISLLNCRLNAFNETVLALQPMLGYKTYAFKDLHICPTCQTKFNSTHFKNL